MVDAIWAMRFEQYSTEALREWVRKSRPGSESPADLAAIEELAKRVVAKRCGGVAHVKDRCL